MYYQATNFVTNNVLFITNRTKITKVWCDGKWRNAVITEHFCQVLQHRLILSAFNLTKVYLYEPMFKEQCIPIHAKYKVGSQVDLL